jgi:excisionase family DNA binding protein
MKLAYSIREAAAASGVGRTKLYQEMNAGNLKAVKLGSRTLIKSADLEAFVSSLAEKKSA